jgi:hypothetical protein
MTNTKTFDVQITREVRQTFVLKVAADSAEEAYHRAYQRLDEVDFFQSEEHLEKHKDFVLIRTNHVPNSTLVDVLGSEYGDS